MASELMKRAADRVITQGGWRSVPTAITREQMGAVVDQVFGGGIEDTSIIEQIYAVAVASAPRFFDEPEFERSIVTRDSFGNRVPSPSEWFGKE